MPPVAEYTHSGGDCSVTGGFVYRGKAFPSMQGTYFFADFCIGNIQGLQNVGGVFQNSLLLASGQLITTFGQDESGTLYVADQRAGVISIVSGPEPFPDVRANGSDGPVALARSEGFSVTAVCIRTIAAV